VIVSFQTGFGQLTMHGEVAVALLRAMGHTGSVPGAILAADLPAALASLERVLETSGHLPSGPPPQAAEDDEDDDREREPAITLRTRAVPLLELMRTAIGRGSDLMWDRA
jgi:hypothetical protein